MEYTIKISQQDAQVISQALGELPLKISVNTFGRIQQQIQEQDKASAIPIEELTK